MSIFNKVRYGLNAEGRSTSISVFQPRIYIVKKDDIYPILDEADSKIVIDLNSVTNIRFYKIQGDFKAQSTHIQTIAGPRYRETVSIHVPSLSAEFTNQLTVLGNYRLCVITIKEDSEIELYGAAVGLSMNWRRDYSGYNIEFETVNGSKEPGLPKEISIAAADGSRSMAAAIAEIERIVLSYTTD